MARSRRRRLSRWVTGFTAAVAAAMLAPVALNAANDLSPDLGPIDNSVLLITPWTRQLIDAPARGALAKDAGLLGKVENVLRATKTGPMHGYPTKVLFAEDVGDRRIVVAVRHSKTHQVGVVVAARGGARAEDFAGQEMRVKSLTPFTAVEFGFGVAQYLRHVGVGLAPPGCTVAVATQDSAAPQWRVSGGGDYLVWSDSVADRLVRVTCAGTTRFQGALLDLNDMVGSSGDLSRFQVAASATSGFDVPADVLDQMVEATYPPQSVGQLQVLFAGTPPGIANPVYVAADPVDKGRWRLQIRAGGATALILTTADVLAADAVVAVDIPNDDSRRGLLVVAPRSAVRVEIRDPSSNALLESAALVAGAGTVSLRAAEDMVLRAFDADGKLVGTGVTPLPKPAVPSELSMPETTQNWN
jgi:hypothetical protein